jgi:type II secretion system protein D
MTPHARHIPPFRTAAALLAAAAAFAAGSPTLAQAASDPGRPATDARGRRPVSNEPTVLAFKNVTVEQVIPFIVESTGKVVLPQQDILAMRITLLNDQPIPRERALDLVFLALQQAGVGVVETPELVILRNISEITRQDVPVIGPDESVLDRTDPGTIVEKIFALRHASAENIGDIIDDSIPDYAKMFVDAESNQIVVMGNIALLQRLERIITSLDRPNAASLRAETFRLRYADATQIAENIRELYAADSRSTQQSQFQSPFQRFFQQQQQQRGGQGGRGGATNQRNNQGQRAGQPGAGNRPQSGATDSAAPSANLRVTANTQQNSITVVAEPEVIEQIREQIEVFWDRPLPEEAVVPRIYDLRNSDPVKVKALLEGLFGQGSTTTAAATQFSAAVGSGGVGRLAGQFSFQAIPEAGRLVVISKSPDNLAVIDKIIEGLDQPISAGLPRVVELKHAGAEELAEQLNALLAEEGTLAQIRRAESGLSDNTVSASPFSEQTLSQSQNAQADTSNPDNIYFWWQRARPPTDSAGSSNLVAKVRVVPVWRQNAVMVMAPTEYQQAVVDLITQLDKPGRQVLISAIIAEISAEDALSLGLRWGSAPIQPTNPDNAVSIGAGFSGTETNVFGSLFETSVLNVGVDVNAVLQALAQRTAVNILSEPRIFTSDNQEAEFFDGQDIPFITDTQATDQGNLIQSFDYRAVGIQLRVRPRITVQRDVDLQVNLELSSIQPQQTLFGGFIVDRRETTTHVIVRDGQTIVISGILRSEDSKVRRKIPLLGDLPLIGGLFQSVDDVTTNSELVAFITPIVIDNPERNDEVNTPFRQRLEQLKESIRPSGTEGNLVPPATPEQLDPPVRDPGPGGA